jgi:hypothetical protein
MSILNSHQHGLGVVSRRGPRQPSVAGKRLSQTAVRSVRRSPTALKAFRRAIAIARLRYLRLKLLWRGAIGEKRPSQSDAEWQRPDRPGKFPQRPMLLDDKWDF